MSSRATFITPTYDRDLERFTLLRESMERCQVDVPHIAVVDHEDLPLFKKIPYAHKLTILSSQDVLPPAIEARRTAKKYRKRHPYYWLKPKPIIGWAIQQVMKLRSPEYVDTEGILCLDSDVFFVDRVEDSDFFSADGKLHLYEDPTNFTVETVSWMAESMHALHLQLNQKPLLFIHNPVPMHRDVVLKLRQKLEEIHGESWIEIFLKLGLTEYTTYGVFARFVNGLDKVSPVEPPYTLNYWVPHQVEDLESTMLKKIEETGARIILMNSHIGKPVESYRHLVNLAWAASGK